MGGGEDEGWFLGGECVELSLRTLTADSPSGFLTTIILDLGSGSEQELTKSMENDGLDPRLGDFRSFLFFN